MEQLEIDRLFNACVVLNKRSGLRTYKRLILEFAPTHEEEPEKYVKDFPRACGDFGSDGIRRVTPFIGKPIKVAWWDHSTNIEIVAASHNGLKPLGHFIEFFNFKPA